MSIKNTDNNPEDKEFDQLLTDLYDISLFDEDFQQSVMADLKQLPPENIALLNESTQSFIEDKEPPAELTDAVLADLAKRTSPLPKTEQTKTLDKQSFWGKLFSRGNRSFSILSPAMTIPTSLAFGLFLGVILAPTFKPEAILPIDSFRTGNDTPVTRGGGGRVVDSSSNSANDREVRETLSSTSKAAAIALEDIASLILDGEIEEAEQQLKQFKQDYPDFQTNSEE